MIKFSPKFCMGLCSGLLSIVLHTSFACAQDDHSDVSQSLMAQAFSSEPDWLTVSTDSQSGTLLTDSLRVTAPDGSSDELELSGAQRPGAEANPFEANLKQLQKRIDELEASEKKRADSDKKKKEDESKKAEGWQDMSTDKWTVKLGGHVQLDYINWANADPAIKATQDYLWQTVRDTASATFGCR